MKYLCDQREFPPQVTIKLSAITEGQPKESTMTLNIGGALNRITTDELRLDVDLLPSDVCVPETKRKLKHEIPQLQ